MKRKVNGSFLSGRNCHRLEAVFKKVIERHLRVDVEITSGAPLNAKQGGHNS